MIAPGHQNQSKSAARCNYVHRISFHIHPGILIAQLVWLFGIEILVLLHIFTCFDTVSLKPEHRQSDQPFRGNYEPLATSPPIAPLFRQPLS
jgi:hypothetical protein